MTKEKNRGSFTLPGESGYEALTLKMAEKWGADVIRDSDGTVLSEDIIHAGYDIYSTICIIRDHNSWAKRNMDKLQQCFLVTDPAVATGRELTISLMDGFFDQQFQINASPDSMKYWQVYDRTAQETVPEDRWTYHDNKTVTIQDIIPWHKYTVSFMAYRIWEEISMYNHTTNGWDKEHLMQIDPIHKETREYLLNWMEQWCREHPYTKVVRFTSLFYNFVWIWGSNPRNRHLFTDWGSYDFTVSPPALDQFKEQYGYTLTAEDFINKGRFHVTHMPADRHKLDWMEFINNFVIGFAKELIDIVHNHGKLAYVFYDDSWVGMEPYNGRFHEFGFDGLIKCIFSGYEARLCSGVDVRTHEIRLHPYLFPVGLGGLPTFAEGGDPVKDARGYWINIRRALLRAPIDRIGLGGYLHLVEEFPDFCDYIAMIADEFRQIKNLHKIGKPYCISSKVAVLHSWGRLRSWTLSGHFHETDMHDLVHINEALSGLPVEVSFISFEDIKQGRLKEFDVVINAGYAGSAWSGGNHWSNSEVVERLTQWVYEGGAFLGVNEPSAVEGYDSFFRMAHVLGIDKDTGARVSHGSWDWQLGHIEGLLPRGCRIKPGNHLYLTDGRAEVLAEEEGKPVLSVYDFGRGKGIYLSSYEVNPVNIRLLLNLILYAGGEGLEARYITDNPFTECTYYPESKTLIVLNQSDAGQTAGIGTDFGKITLNLKPYESKIITVG